MNHYLNTDVDKIKISDNIMADKKYKDKNVRKLMKSGSTSLVVSIPVEILKSLGWKEKQKLSVKKINGGVQIRDWKK